MTTVPILERRRTTTGGEYVRVDISFVDQTTQTYYLADVQRRSGRRRCQNQRADLQISAKPAFKGLYRLTTAPPGLTGGVAAFPWLL